MGNLYLALIPLIIISPLLGEGLGVFGACDASRVCLEKILVVPINLLVIDGRDWYHLWSRGFYLIGFPCKNRVLYFLHYLLYCVRLWYFFLCLIGLLSWGHLTTRREKEKCVIVPLFSTIIYDLETLIGNQHQAPSKKQYIGTKPV